MYLPVTRGARACHSSRAARLPLALARRAAEVTRMAKAAAELEERGEAVTSRSLAQAAHISLNTACSWLRQIETAAPEDAPMVSGGCSRRRNRSLRLCSKTVRASCPRTRLLSTPILVMDAWLPNQAVRSDRWRLRMLHPLHTLTRDQRDVLGFLTVACSDLLRAAGPTSACPAHYHRPLHLGASLPRGPYG